MLCQFRLHVIYDQSKHKFYMKIDHSLNTPDVLKNTFISESRNIFDLFIFISSLLSSHCLQFILGEVAAWLCQSAMLITRN